MNRSTRHLRSGRYITCDVRCKVCREVLGWFYEHSFDPSQKEKEGKVVLEIAKLRSGEEKETVNDDEYKFLLTANGLRVRSTTTK